MTTNQAIQYKDSMKVPEPTLRRLPWYLSNVKLLKQRGERYVSSTQISKEINIDASQIAKDLSYVNISGRTRVGYEVDTLIAVLEDFLGFTDMHKAFLFGVGSLGGALLRDSGLKHFNKITGETACRLLIDQIKGDRTVRQVIIPTNLQIRESSRKK